MRLRQCWRCLRLAAVAVLTADLASAQVAVPADRPGFNEAASSDIVVKVEAVPDTSAARALALIEIARPPAAVWAVMLDCDRTLKFIARLRACRVTAADPAGRWDVREHVVDWLWPLPSVRSVFRSEYEPFTLIRFRRIEGTLKSLEGSWRLQPIREGRATRLTYEAHIDPGLPVPGVLMRSAIENELRDTLAGLRRETLRGG